MSEQPSGATTEQTPAADETVHPTTDIRVVSVVGAGAIGASWAGLALSQGLQVAVHDPAPGSNDRLLANLEARFSTVGIGEDDDRWRERLIDARSLQEAAERADLVLESGPERLDIKRDIFEELDRHARPDVLLTSSSSGIPASAFQDACTRFPSRVLIAHPFNPPHLVPLVEIVGGSLTSEEAVESAMTVFRALGKSPVRIRRELPGHVVNRLQAALWREAYHLVEIGAVSVEDLDLAVSSGPGLRWALLGPFATQHLSGGPGGLKHILEHLGPPMVEWWHDLGEPELSPELIDRLVAGVDDEIGDQSTADLTSRRDAALVDLLATKRTHRLS